MFGFLLQFWNCNIREWLIKQLNDLILLFLLQLKISYFFNLMTNCNFSFIRISFAGHIDHLLLSSTFVLRKNTLDHLYLERLERSHRILLFFVTTFALPKHLFTIFRHGNIIRPLSLNSFSLRVHFRDALREQFFAFFHRRHLLWKST